MRHTIKTATITVMLCLGLMLLAGVAQTPSYRFQQAVDLLESKGDVPGALKLFEELAKSPDRSVAARSLLYVGSCHEKLGKDGAQKAYERIVREFADQREPTAEAQARLAALGRAAAAANGRALAVRRVWAGRNIDVMGAASADGRYLTFVDWDTGNLAVHDLATGQNRALTGKRAYADSPEFALDSHVSPDGKLVAYTWYNKDYFYELRLVGFDGSDSRVLYRGDKLEYLHPAGWFPDGKRLLAVLRDNNKNHQIVTLSPADGSVRVLKALDWRAPWRIGISPDGRYLVYDRAVREDSPQRDVFLLSVADGRETLLVEHPADDAALGWAPEGNAVFFASDRAGTWDAWMVRVSAGKAEGAPELVKKDLGQAVPMGFTRGGSFYYGLIIGMNEVYTAAMDPATGKLLGTPVAVGQQVGTNEAVDWSPDGQHLAYISDRLALGVRGISIRSLATGAVRQLSPPLRYIRALRWSPDGRWFLVRASDKQGWGVFLVDSQTGQVTTVVHTKPLVSAVWSPDGKAIFYLAGPRIAVRDVSSGQERELFRSAVAPSSGGTLVLSPDGRLLAFATRDPDTKAQVLKVMPAAGGEPRELFLFHDRDSQQTPAALDWTPDGCQVLFLRRAGQKNEVWRIPTEGGEPQKTELAMEGLRSLRFHPDGKRIAFSAGRQPYEVWVMENFLPPLKSAAK